jgi:hypothetical protein
MAYAGHRFSNCSSVTDAPFCWARSSVATACAVTSSLGSARRLSRQGADALSTCPAQYIVSGDGGARHPDHRTLAAVTTGETVFARRLCLVLS